MLLESRFQPPIPAPLLVLSSCYPDFTSDSGSFINAVFMLSRFQPPIPAPSELINAVFMLFMMILINPSFLLKVGGGERMQKRDPGLSNAISMLFPT